MFTEALTESTRRALGVVSAAQAVKDFYLAGGTAAALQLGHRVSVDLDFFRQDRFSPEQLRADLAAEGVLLAGERATPAARVSIAAGSAGRQAGYRHRAGGARTDRYSPGRGAPGAERGSTRGVWWQ